jgi:hypothetical protein
VINTFAASSNAFFAALRPPRNALTASVTGAIAFLILVETSLRFCSPS